ncbi:DUF6603 domain-containing protein [Flavobacterium sp. UBA4854]|uniref:DUF6603 domain-containing protein n=1 Tax=Flavobacterium sp. UBA4854 TaxID=1946548 RepID=UPI00257EBC5F|nr:DUF6603 domain-containing protein [Flavobacterium sp. UBA4854]
MTKKDILEEITWFSQPLFEASSSPDSLAVFFREFGYNINSSDIANLLNSIKSLTNTVAALLDDDPNTNAAFDPKDLITLFKSLKSLSEDNNFRDYFSDDFFIEIIDYLIIRYLSNKLPIVYAIFFALGLIEKEVDTTRDFNYEKKSLHWDRISDFISDNSQWAKEVYGWRGNPINLNEKKFDFNRLLEVLNLFISATGLSLYFIRKIELPELNNYIKNISVNEDYFEGVIPIFQSHFQSINFNENPSFANEAGLKVIPYGDYNNIENLGFAITPYVKGSASGGKQLTQRLLLNITISAEATGGIFITINPSGVSNNTGGNINAGVKFEFIYGENNKQIQLLKIGDSTKVEFSKFKFAVSGNIKGEFSIAAGLDNLVATIDLSNDAFLSNLIREPITINAGNLLLGWNNKGGVFFEGGNNLAVQIATHIELGPINISRIGFQLEFLEKNKFTLDVTGGLNLGVISATVEEFGISVELVKRANGFFGTHDLAFGFKPPKGLGLSINAGAVIGGGYLFFDFEKEEYAGVMELTIAGFISAKAIGLITTKMPDGSKGFSMLVIITAEFFPPFQLGYGFTLNAVGGLLGLNRTMLVDPLRNAVRTGAVNSIMFPQNVIANAPRIISDLKAIFPTYKDKFLIGPMAKIGWGTPTLISLSLGIIIEIPGNIAILGVLKVVLPTDVAPIVKIQVLFVGIIDFDKKMLSFDASLYESSILTMTLEGDMAVRLKWGDNPDFLLTVGGFHPSYTPPPLSLPTMRRLSLNILNTDIALIRVECYQAVTSNTVQFGAKAEIIFDLSVCSIQGYIGFDALFQFNPFYFIIEVSACFKLSAAGMDILSVRVRMSLEGPTPWRARGTGSVSILFFEISADFDVTWGDPTNTTLPEIAIYQKFIDDLQKREYWNTLLSNSKNLLVTLRNIEKATTEQLVLHPAGSLVVQQKMLPLQVKIDKVGSQKVSDVQKITIKRASSSGIELKISDVNEDFARAQYQNLSDAEKLSKPSFEKMPGGVQISLGGLTIKNGKFVRKIVEYEITIVDKEPVKPLRKGKLFSQIGLLFEHFLKGNSVSKSVLSKNYSEKLQPFTEKLNVNEESYVVAFQDSNKAHTHNSTFATEMMAQTYMEEQVAKQPSLKKELHIIPNYELQES